MYTVDQCNGSPFAQSPFRTKSAEIDHPHLNVSFELTKGAIIAKAVKKPVFTMKMRRSSCQV